MISFFATANRPHLWENLYKNLISSCGGLEFEVVFCGDKKPEFDLPNNFKFIYSEVKPAQCSYIAYLHSQGDILYGIGDDLSFNKNGVRNMYKHAKKCKKNYIISAKYRRFNKKMRHTFWGSRDKTKKQPTMACGIFATRKLWEKILPIDKNFVALYWDCDLMMKSYSLGGGVYLCKDAIVQEITKMRDLNRLSGRLSSAGAMPLRDRMLFYSYWVSRKKKRFSHRNIEFIPNPTRNGPKKYKIHKKRSVPVEPIENRSDLLTVSQGETLGMWK